MKTSAILIFLVLVAIAKSTIADSQPMLFRYRDDDGYIRMGVLRKPEEKKSFSIVPTSSSSSAESSQQNESDDSEIDLEDTSAYMHEFSSGTGTFDEFDSMHTDEDFHAEKRMAGVLEEEEDNSSTENKKFNIYAKSPKLKPRYKPKSSFKKINKQKIHKEKIHKENKHKPKHSKSVSTSSEEHPPPHSSESVEEPKPPKESSEEHPGPPPKESSEEKCDKCKRKKKIYVYKQPPIIVRPKPTSVLIKQKPIVVQPPPLVVHQPAPKPCNPVIKYQPPNVKVKPVIVKIRKPKPTSCETPKPKPCETPKKSCKKCHRKPKCNRCQRKKCQCRRNHHGHGEIWT